MLVRVGDVISVCGGGDSRNVCTTFGTSVSACIVSALDSLPYGFHLVVVVGAIWTKIDVPRFVVEWRKEANK